MKQFRILCTGNPSEVGFPQTFQQLYPDTKFLSRATGYNFSDPTTESKFREQLAGCNVLINYSYIEPGVQERLLTIASEVWTSGHIINFGSVSENFEVLRNYEPAYSSEKLSLRERSLSVNNENLKSTHIIPGPFWGNTPGRMLGMDPLHIAKSIQWILEADFEIPLFAIQQTTDRTRGFLEFAAGQPSKEL